MLNKAHTIVAPQREPVTSSASALMRVKLVRKFANAINGIDLSNVRVGDVLELSAYEAALLISEGWAEHVTPRNVVDDVYSASNPDAVENE
jgi:hypothetical protein